MFHLCSKTALKLIGSVAGSVLLFQADACYAKIEVVDAAFRLRLVLKLQGPTNAS
jgi:hypothetical protein